MIEVTYDFRNKELIRCRVWDWGNTPIFTHTSTDTLEAAKNFLNKYQAFSKTPHSQTMINMLSAVSELKTTTIEEGNIKLSVIVEENSKVSFIWMNTVNGIKNLHNRALIQFYNDDFVLFSNNWNRYDVGSSEVKFSREQALDIVKEKAKTFTYMLGDETFGNLQVVSAPFVELTMQPRADYSLYPHWEIYLSLDKMYPGNVGSFQVMMWADTGEITSMRALGRLGVPENMPDSTIEDEPTPAQEQDLTDQKSNNHLAILIITSAVAIFITIAIGIIFTKKKKTR